MAVDSFAGKLEPDGVAFPFIISTPVWGAGHLGLFLKVCLPSLLAAGNLPSLAPNPQNQYLIYTRPEDEAELKAAATFRRLSEIVSVDVRLIQEKITEPHRTMSNCHIDSIRRADEVGGAAIFLPPDCVWSENSMRALQRIARSGKSVVHMSGIRLDRDSVVPVFANRYSDDGTVLSLGPRELVSIGMHHLHPIALTHFWKEYDGQLMPANLIWNVPNEGLLLRCFHLHPLMVKSQVRFAKFGSTIDDDLALKACPDASRDYVVTDSDEILAFEMSGLSRFVGTICPKASVDGVASWAEFGANPRHRELVKSTIRLKAVDDSGAAWSAAQAESDDVVNSVAEMNALSTVQLFYRFPSVFAGRAMAAALGRSNPSDQGIFAVTRFLVPVVVFLVNLNAALYRRIFLVDGVPRITHPFWLIRKGMMAALQKAIFEGDREIVLVGVDPQIAAEIGAAHPDGVVHAFGAGFDAAPTLLGRSGLHEVDTLVVVDVDLLDVRPMVRPHIGRRQVLLRLTGDSRPVCGYFDEIRFFGGRGTRLSALLWNGTRRVRTRVRPISQITHSVAKAAGAPLRPLFYVGLAFISCAVNVLGLLLDAAKGERWHVFQEKGDSLPHGPST